MYFNLFQVRFKSVLLSNKLRHLQILSRTASVEHFTYGNWPLTALPPFNSFTSSIRSVLADCPTMDRRRDMYRTHSYNVFHQSPSSEVHSCVLDMWYSVFSDNLERVYPKWDASCSVWRLKRWLSRHRVACLHIGGICKKTLVWFCNK